MHDNDTLSVAAVLLCETNKLTKQEEQAFKHSLFTSYPLVRTYQYLWYGMLCVCTWYSSTGLLQQQFFPQACQVYTAVRMIHSRSQNDRISRSKKGEHDHFFVTSYLVRTAVTVCAR